MRYSKELDLARSEQLRAQSWHRAQITRCANLQKAIFASSIARDGHTERLRAELQVAQNTTTAAAQDVAGFKRIVRALGG